jgi:NADPH:quinone reductase-like Zn-dependent oxidoreductase
MSLNMRAAVNTRYGPPEVIKLRSVAKPEPQPGEVLVQVHATTVNRSDCGFLRAHPFAMRAFTGLLVPKRKILGMDFAGVVEARGEGSKIFTIGQRVFGVCSWARLGAHAEYVCVPEQRNIAAIPANVSFECAVVGEGAIYAHASLKSLELERGQRILIYGASGAIGVAAVQLARALGAHVTAVVATRHLALAREIGAERVIDYTQEDFTQIGAVFDCVLDAVGKVTFAQCRKLLKAGGPFVATDAGPGGDTLRRALWSAITGDKRVRIATMRPDPGFIAALGQLMEEGVFHAVIDRQYPLTSIVEAYRYVEQGQKTGIVVINVQS